MSDHTANVLREIAQERKRQDAKWGVQDHASVPIASRTTGTVISTDHGSTAYVFPSASIARDACDSAAQNQRVSWMHIAVEELAEAIDAYDETSRKDELIQLAAVIVAWIENIDRRNSH